MTDRKEKGSPTTKSCGCVEQVFDDETVDITPCPPHGLMQAAKCLLDAGNALGNVGVTILAETERLSAEQMNRSMADAVDAALKKKSSDG